MQRSLEHVLTLSFLLYILVVFMYNIMVVLANSKGMIVLGIYKRKAYTEVLTHYSEIKKICIYVIYVIINHMRRS